MNKIIDIYKSTNKPLFSFEFFPPKTQKGDQKFFETISKILNLKPSYFTVTYGAGGSTQNKTLEIVQNLKSQYNISLASHLTGVNSDESRIEDFIFQLESHQIYNLIVLRGDLPKNKDISFEMRFKYASDLIRFIKQKHSKFCLGGGCYPEKHPEASTLEQDISNLKYKVDVGVDFLISQLFFINKNWFDFYDIAVQKSINIPIIPGIMPIFSYKQIENLQNLTSCKFPKEFINKLYLLKDDFAASYEFSVEFTVNQCRELIQSGVKGIHFYTLNNSHIVYDIVKELQK